jgi:heme/copper-type cytochrome/quinol oxidase subunit 2
VLRFIREREVDEIVDYVGTISIIIVIVAIVVGFVWWFVAKRIKLRQKTELTDPIAQW